MNVCVCCIWKLVVKSIASVAQWQSICLRNRRLWVRVPSGVSYAARRRRCRDWSLGEIGTILLAQQQGVWLDYEIFYFSLRANNISLFSSLQYLVILLRIHHTLSRVCTFGLGMLTAQQIQNLQGGRLCYGIYEYSITITHYSSCRV